MAGTTKQRHDEIQLEAMQIVSSFSVEKLDALPERPRRAQLVAMAHQLKEAANVADWRTARAHIAKACRRSRYSLSSQESQSPGWGGKRPGAGVKSAMKKADELTDYGRNEPSSNEVNKNVDS